MVETMTDGTIKQYPWTPFSQWTTPDKLKGQFAGSSVPVTVRVRFWSEIPASEQAVIEAAAPSTYQNPTPIPPPPPGSTLYVPAPGSGLEPTLTLPGSTTPVPVSQVPPDVWNWQSKGYPASPGAVVGEGAPVSPENPAQQAGIGGLAAFVLLGVVAGSFLSKKHAGAR